MPTFKLKYTGGANAEPEQGYYSGDKPPVAPYNIVVKRARMKVNSSGDHMVVYLLEIAEPDGSRKAQYNGYGFWTQYNVTQSGERFLNASLDVIVGKPARVKFWSSAITVDNEAEPNILKIGGKPVVGQKARVTTKDKVYQGKADLTPTAWFPYAESEEEPEEEPEEPEETVEEVEPVEDGTEPEEPEETELEEPAEEDWDEESLMALDLAELKATAREWGIKIFKSSTQEKLVAAILEAQSEEPEQEGPPF
jgi:hypothetical protein